MSSIKSTSISKGKIRVTLRRLLTVWARHRRQVRDLYARCEELLYALKDATEGSEAIKIDMMVQKGVAYVHFIHPSLTPVCRHASQRLLDDIKHKMIDWRNAGMIKHVLHMPDISDAIRQCNQDIDTFLETFQV